MLVIDWWIPDDVTSLHYSYYNIAKTVVLNLKSFNIILYLNTLCILIVLCSPFFKKFLSNFVLMASPLLSCFWQPCVYISNIKTYSYIPKYPEYVTSLYHFNRLTFWTLYVKSGIELRTLCLTALLEKQCTKHIYSCEYAYTKYRKRWKFGVTKVWWIRFSNILVDKSLANLPQS